MPKAWDRVSFEANTRPVHAGATLGTVLFVGELRVRREFVAGLLEH